VFERFTDAARDAVLQAHESARETGAPSIGTPHLLVGAAPGVPGLPPEPLKAAIAGVSDAAALAAIGIDLEAVRHRVEEAFGPGALSRRRDRCGRRSVGGALPFTPTAKAALEGALREALAHGDRHIAAGHIVLGVLRTEDPAALEVLRRAGLEPDRVRTLASAARDRSTGGGD
jgi:ATP-dependent Clp protease ATP-binding subunit ClpA